MTRKTSKKNSESSEIGKRSKSKSSQNRKQESFRFMGIDPSLTGLGLVVLGKKSRALRLRRYKTEPLREGASLSLPTGQLAPDRFRGQMEERIAWLARKVLASEDKFKPILVIIEGYAFSKNMRGVSDRHELGGVVKNKLFEAEVLFVTVTPTELKKHATGNGNASKVEMIAEAKKHDPRISDSDTADAYWCAHWGRHNFRKLVDL